mmetsp:Transcript_9818/g.20009  ORF Transcript_9818/g.20009 Transcript_9818/m.20009 type:complete len:213 (-) Transcript_9818:123-761(-)
MVQCEQLVLGALEAGAVHVFTPQLLIVHCVENVVKVGQALYKGPNVDWRLALPSDLERPIKRRVTNQLGHKGAQVTAELRGVRLQKAIELTQHLLQLCRLQRLRHLTEQRLCLVWERRQLVDCGLRGSNVGENAQQPLLSPRLLRQHNHISFGIIAERSKRLQRRAREKSEAEAGTLLHLIQRLVGALTHQRLLYALNARLHMQARGHVLNT